MNGGQGGERLMGVRNFGALGDDIASYLPSLCVIEAS